MFPFTHYTNGMISLLAKIPGTVSLPQIGLGVVIACYAAMFTWLWLYPKLKRRLVNYTLIAGLALGSVGAWSAGLRQADGMLHIRILPSTGSPALILQTP